jgi:arsenate reductase-like glutaredoxin family protein
MMVKIFWQPECPKCALAKEIGKQLKDMGIKVEYYNIKEADGLAEAALFAVMATPSIVVTDSQGKEKASWRAEVPDIEEIKKALG